MTGKTFYLGKDLNFFLDYLLLFFNIDQISIMTAFLSSK
jgi:hypothetical protein